MGNSMHTSKNDFSIIILLLISPVLGLYYSVRKLSWQQRKWALIFFVTIFGSVLTFSKEADSARYQQQVYGYVGMSFNVFLQMLKNIVTLKPLPGQPTDVYVHTISYLVGGVFGLPRLFFPLVSFVFGYFYITALSKILIWDKGTRKPLTFSAVVFLLIILRGVDTMQSIRTWTGMWVLFNGVFGYLQTNQKKYIWLMLFSPLIHFGYLIMAIPAFLMIFIKKFPTKIFIIIYFLSFFVSVNPGGVLSTLKETELGEQKAGYYHEGNDLIRERTTLSATHWYARYGSTDAVYLGGNVFAFTLIIGGFFKKRMTKIEAGLFTVGLLMAALANFGSFIYVFYSRSMANAVLYFLATVVLLAIRGELLKGIGSKLIFTKIMLWISILIFIPKIVYTLSNILVYTSVYILAFPIIGWMTESYNVSIRELLGLLL